MDKGTSNYSFNSYKEFCDELQVKDPLDHNFMPRCIEFFQNEKGHDENSSKSICYVGFQQKYQNMINAHNDSISEATEKKYPRTIEKAKITKDRIGTEDSITGEKKTGKTKTGRKIRDDAGTRQSTGEKTTYSKFVAELIKQGYSFEDARNIALDRNERHKVRTNIIGSDGRNLVNASFIQKLDNLFLIEKKKKKTKEKKSRGAYGYPYDNDSESEGEGGE